MVEYNDRYADYAPPKGHPLCWLFWEKPFELGYLSWGNRWYGDAPANTCLHDGWHYFILLDGTPDIFVQGKTMKMRPGQAFLCHPDCPVGHFDKPSRRCQMLTWVWRTPPAHSALQPAKGGFIKVSLEASILRQLRNLHAQCREAVAFANERSMLQLRAARLHLDLCMLEGREHRRAADGDFRINLATEYLRNHLNELEPVKNLCNYLHISEASLKRLFIEHTGKGPRAYALEWRMQWARDQLVGRETSIKSVAYSLGYRHPNDFSRAFKRRYGLTATRFLSQDK